ncbi:MAG TPA: alpha/beta hydrolase [Vicinamibacterales bacterium]
MADDRGLMTDGYIDLHASPLAPGRSPVRIRYRDAGSGPPVVFLHGGWGYEFYPFDGQTSVLEARHRVLIPDRTGYGRSGALDVQRPDFHRRAAEETLSTLDTLHVDRAAFWGHSDGAVIALWIAVLAPDRVTAVVAEATHYFRKKPRSRAFFETMRDAPEELGARVAAALEGHHGSRWRSLIQTNGEAWLRIADEAASDAADLYDERLAEIVRPVLLVHGRKDPRTEPGELDALRAALERHGAATGLLLLDEGAHSPHTEAATAERVTREATAFLDGADGADGADS